MRREDAVRAIRSDLNDIPAQDCAGFFSPPSLPVVEQVPYLPDVAQLEWHVHLAPLLRPTRRTSDAGAMLAGIPAAAPRTKRGSCPAPAHRAGRIALAQVREHLRGLHARGQMQSCRLRVGFCACGG
jgi:hypothetical protein